MPDALLWNLDEAARQLGGISTKTVRRLAQQGAFPLVKLGRRAMIPALAVTHWVNHNQPARPEQEIQVCQSTNAVTSTGCASPHQTAASYGKLLQLPTADRRRNSI
jgi:excisionase family DNA binding protein